MDAASSEHTFGGRDEQGRPQLCLLCPDDEGRAGSCDHAGYSKRWLRFYRAHMEEFEGIYHAADPSTCSNLRERLDREYKTLPPRHDCTCRCPAERGGHPPCVECRKLRAQRVQADIPVEIGRHGSRAHAPMPNVECLDVQSGYAA